MTRLVPVTALLAVLAFDRCGGSGATGGRHSAQAHRCRSRSHSDRKSPRRQRAQTERSGRQRRQGHVQLAGFCRRRRRRFVRIRAHEDVRERARSDQGDEVGHREPAGDLDRSRRRRWWPTRGPARERFRGSPSRRRRSRRRCGPRKAESGWPSTTRRRGAARAVECGMRGCRMLRHPPYRIQVAVRRSRSHQTRQTGCFTIGAVALQPNAFWNSGMLRDDAVHAVAAGRMRVGPRVQPRDLLGSRFSHHICPQPRKKRCSGVKPSSVCRGASSSGPPSAPSARGAGRRCRRCSRRASACRSASRRRRRCSREY